MSKIEKILKKWESRPILVEKDEVLSVLKRFHFNIDQKSGSHIVVSHPSLVNKPNFGRMGEFTVVIKSGQKVKGLYLERILEAISIIQGED